MSEPMSLVSCLWCDKVHYATEPCDEFMIIDDPVLDSREISPELRERMVEWHRSVLPNRRG